MIRGWCLNENGLLLVGTVRLIDGLDKNKNDGEISDDKINKHYWLLIFIMKTISTLVQSSLQNQCLVQKITIKTDDTTSERK